MNYTSAQMAKSYGLKMLGRDCEINGLGLCNRKQLKPYTLSYVTNEDYLPIALANDDISALIIPDSLVGKIDLNLKSYLISDTPEETFYRILQDIYNTQQQELPESHIGKNCNIHPTAIIEKGVSIGDNVCIGAFTIIHSKTAIGNNTTISSHCSIGSNGFQALKDSEGKPYNVNHIGGVKIGSNCYIAEFVNISRALFDGYVTIGNNVLIDAHCHIAHECTIGDDSILTTNTRMFGSSHIGNSVWMSPGSMVMNRVAVRDNCHIAPGAFVIVDTKEGERYIGNPATTEHTYITQKIKLKKLFNNGHK